MQQLVGVVGLGAMGKAIAHNLLQAGFKTTVWNRSQEPIDELASSGAIAAREIADVFKCDVVLSALFNDAAVEEIFLESGVLRFGSSQVIHICMSTISTALAQRLIEAHRRSGVAYVGAPMFEHPDVAAAGKLNMVTAASGALLAAVEPILSVLGKTWCVGDDPRIAHVAKIAGNFMIGCAIETMAESAALISLNGGDPPLFLGMLGETLFASFIYRSYGSAIASGKSPGIPSGLQLPLKDVGLTLGEANSLGTSTPFAKALQEQLKSADAQGFGNEDWPVALANIARI